MQNKDEIPIGKAKDIRGQKFGKLTVLYRVKSNDHRTKWLCQCDCGNTCVRDGCNLKAGIAVQCDHCSGQKKYKKIQIGDKFGKLTVIKELPKRSIGGNKIFLCQCECGNYIEVKSNSLNCKERLSCGCINSKGELSISQILNKNKILFKQQKIFQTCKDKNYLPFDFFVNNKYLIEFDGEQHYRNTDFFGGTKAFNLRKKHDNYKNQWCKENNIPLIRIPYTKLDTLCIEDLMLETTQFRIV